MHVARYERNDVTSCRVAGERMGGAPCGLAGRSAFMTVEGRLAQGTVVSAAEGRLSLVCVICRVCHVEGLA